jgi:hypothetical protein
MTVAVTTTCDEQHTREMRAVIAVHEISAVIYTQHVRSIAVTNPLNMSMAKHDMTRIAVPSFPQQNTSRPKSAYCPKTRRMLRPLVNRGHSLPDIWII